VPPLDKERLRVLDTGVGGLTRQQWRRDIQGNGLPGGKQARCETEHGNFTKVALGSSQNRHGTNGGRNDKQRTLTTCSMLSVRISRRSKAVPVHLGSSIVTDEGREFSDGGG
jgi:hypothetical protein